MSKRQGLAAHFGPLELAILDVLWSGGEMDVAECVKRLRGNQAYTTVKTVMERLVGKGFLARRKEGRQYVYWPSRSRAEVEQEVAATQVRQLVDGFGDLAVANFVRAVRDDTDQLAQVRALLAEIEDQDEPGGAR
ncbi:Predicted transcriptional regulator [Saccharopolyspora antimicrobica]|uniref:Transcriptional regulator n=1 Tax=Saccharopolyspora antimicrobica TaxID=455193 RepID=A0A1I4VQV2_9PSEU|nr:BlaI/MecI/CopY family transcriptional regulator [Saccharopolyspora antimicrobica]RKT87261.1 putative transcriptional regulator [Saccharopolyspora antimicrobica]SFN03477.1 Predicted transcriptional regulator [Saccharopolyspora antimicrobica]